MNFNASHSGDWVVVGLVCDGVHVVGVDVECVPLPGMRGGTPWHEYLQLMNSGFTDREWWDQIVTREHWGLFVSTRTRQMVLRCGDASQVPSAVVEGILRRFIVHWTLKESFIKALGTGVSFGDLSRIEFRWCDGGDGSSSEASADCGTALEDLCPRVYVDGQLLPQWQFRCAELSQGHIVSVALGPARDRHVDREYAQLLGISSTDAVPESVPAASLSGRLELQRMDKEELIAGVRSMSCRI